MGCSGDGSDSELRIDRGDNTLEIYILITQLKEAAIPDLGKFVIRCTHSLFKHIFFFICGKINMTKNLPF